MPERRLLYFVLGVLVVTSVGAVSFDGAVTDGTVGAAALTAIPESWPMICQTEPPNGELGEWGTVSTLVCESPQSTVPGGSIGSTLGVPDGYYFVVTDVLAACYPLVQGVPCGNSVFQVWRYNISDPLVGLDAVTLLLVANANLASAAVHTTGPAMILGPGDYLGGRPQGQPGAKMYAKVLGYLIAEPVSPGT